jgi:hypothetical protein
MKKETSYLKGKEVFAQLVGQTNQVLRKAGMSTTAIIQNE